MDKKDIIQLPNVNKLINEFNLSIPIETLLVSSYKLINGVIVISEIQLINDSGDVVRTVKLDKVLPFLHSMVVKFKETP